MNDQPMTRRDVVVLFAYAILVLHVLGQVMELIDLEVWMPLVKAEGGPTLSSLLLDLAFTSVGCILLSLLVPLISSVTSGAEVLTRGNNWTLLLQVVGLSLIASGLISIGLSIVHGWTMLNSLTKWHLDCACG